MISSPKSNCSSSRSVLDIDYTDVTPEQKFSRTFPKCTDSTFKERVEADCQPSIRLRTPTMNTARESKSRNKEIADIIASLDLGNKKEIGTLKTWIRSLARIKDPAIGLSIASELFSPGVSSVDNEEPEETFESFRPRSQSTYPSHYRTHPSCPNDTVNPFTHITVGTISLDSVTPSVSRDAASPVSAKSTKTAPRNTQSNCFRKAAYAEKGSNSPSPVAVKAPTEEDLELTRFKKVYRRRKAQELSTTQRTSYKHISIPFRETPDAWRQASAPPRDHSPFCTRTPPKGLGWQVQGRKHQRVPMLRPDINRVDESWAFKLRKHQSLFANKMPEIVVLLKKKGSNKIY
ncbi:hypothetical protein JCM33374_g5470 [Metschnikowia sp. JCM 33374]|nr:hypothetical protein JCM33374_g5470 [Metschnikowia sp. JCM 33374]